MPPAKPKLTIDPYSITASIAGGSSFRTVREIRGKEINRWKRECKADVREGDRLQFKITFLR